VKHGWARRVWRAYEGAWWAVRWGVEWWLTPMVAHETPRMRFYTDQELAFVQLFKFVRERMRAIALGLEEAVGAVVRAVESTGLEYDRLLERWR
jgi:hypothetical protein